MVFPDICTLHSTLNESIKVETQSDDECFLSLWSLHFSTKRYIIHPRVAHLLDINNPKLEQYIKTHASELK